MNLKPNKNERISFNTTTMASLGFIAPPKMLGPPLNLAPPKFNLLLRSPLKLLGCYHEGPERQNVSVLPFIFPSVCKFSWNWFIIFFKTQHAVSGPSIVICVSQIFWKTSLSGKNDPKNRVFGLFKKIMSLVLSGICVK